MKLVAESLENLRFQRGLDPKESMGIGILHNYSPGTILGIEKPFALSLFGNTNKRFFKII